MEALYLVCGARRPQLKRNPLGCAPKHHRPMTPARLATLFVYLGTVGVFVISAAVYSVLGGGPGAAIPALGVFKAGVTVALFASFLALGFALLEVRDSPGRNVATTATAGAAGFASLLLSIAAVRLWFF